MTLSAARVVRLALAVAGMAPLLAAGALAASYTKEVGHQGGDHFEVACPSHMVLVGIDYRSDLSLKAIAGFCKNYDSEGRVTGKLYGTAGYGGDLSDGKPRDPLYCRQDEVITKLGVAINQQGHIRIVYMTCSPTVGNGTGIIMGQTKADYKGPGLVASTADTEDCRFGVGFTGATYSGVIRLGLKCAPLDVLNNAPLKVDNGVSGDATDGGDQAGKGGGFRKAGRGTASVAQATTLYDEPAGNEIDYFTPGTPVTVQQCVEGWCQITSPAIGYLWEDDLNR